MITDSCPHWELMEEYAKDAKKNEKPWELWEVNTKGPNSEWSDLVRHPCWYKSYKFRKKQKFININGYELPAPHLTTLPLTQLYYYLDFSRPNGISSAAWCANDTDRIRLRFGIVHLTEEAAISHVKAFKLLQTKSEEYCKK